MSNHHFHRSAGPFTILLFYYFSFPLGSRHRFLHLGSQNLHVRPPFSQVGRPFLHFECRTTIFTGWVPGRGFASRVAKPACRPTIFTGRPAVFASRVAKPECRTTIFTGRLDRLLFCYFTISFPLSSRQEVFLHLRQHFLHVGSRFCISAKRIPARERSGHLSNETIQHEKAGLFADATRCDGSDRKGHRASSKGLRALHMERSTSKVLSPHGQSLQRREYIPLRPGLWLERRRQA